MRMEGRGCWQLCAGHLPQLILGYMSVHICHNSFSVFLKMCTSHCTYGKLKQMCSGVGCDCLEFSSSLFS